jgi:hypothetical protein
VVIKIVGIVGQVRHSGIPLEDFWVKCECSWRIAQFVSPDKQQGVRQHTAI